METLQEEREVFSPFVAKVEASSFDKYSFYMLKFNRPTWSIGDDKLERKAFINGKKI